MESLFAILHGLAVAAFLLAQVWAAVSDLRRFEVPNRVSVIIAVSFLVAEALRGDLTGMALSHLVPGVAVFIVGFALFAAGFVGGGDVKLLAATSLWIGWPLLLPYLFWVSLAGGGLTLLLILYRRWDLPPGMRALPWLRDLHERRNDVPYAVAIALPAICLVPAMPLVTATSLSF